MVKRVIQNMYLQIELKFHKLNREISFVSVKQSDRNSIREIPKMKHSLQ